MCSTREGFVFFLSKTTERETPEGTVFRKSSERETTEKMNEKKTATIEIRWTKMGNGGQETLVVGVDSIRRL